MDLLRIILPVIIMLMIGMLCREKNLISLEGIQGLQALVMNFTLPVSLFANFYTSELQLQTMIFPVILFALSGGGLFLGKAICRITRQKDPYLPFYLTGYEAGMLGFALLGLLMGSDQLGTFAVMDIGQEIAIFTIYIAMLKGTGGQKQSLGEAVKGMLTTPVLVAVLLGLAFTLTGLGPAIQATSFGPVLSELCSFIGTPTSAVILVVIGYRMNLRELNLAKTGKAILLRILQQAILAAAVFGIFFLLGGDFTSKLTLISAAVFFILPSPFIIPLYQKGEKEKEFYSAALSAYTILTILMFLGLAVVTSMS